MHKLESPKTLHGQTVRLLEHKHLDSEDAVLTQFEDLQQ